MYVNAAFHKTKFKTNEEGSEGAAITVIGAMRSVSVERPVPAFSFVADRPYLEIVVHHEADTALFMNRVVRPEYK